MLTSFVGIPVGNAVAGPLASTFGVDRTMIGTAVVFVLASFAPLLARSVRELDTRAADAGAELEPAT